MFENIFLRIEWVEAIWFDNDNLDKRLKIFSFGIVN